MAFSQSSGDPFIGKSGFWLWAAFVAALLTLGGSLFLSLGMGLNACPLCFYQRTFAMSLAAVLGMGILTGAIRYVRLSLLALPLAVGGLGVAAFHVYLEMSGKLECPMGLFDLGTAPQQSMVMFVLVSVCLLLDALRGARVGLAFWPALAGAILLGAFLAVFSSISNPPMPQPPTQPYDEPPKVCRPPYQMG